MSRCVIIGGAPISSYETIKACFTADDTFVFCDSGLLHRDGLGVTPDLIVGDFDSCENPHLPVETIELPCEKDDTDTMFAAKEMLHRGYADFLLAGVIGERLDHTLGNLSVLCYLDAQGAKAVAVDDHSEISVVGREGAVVEECFSFFSLLCMGPPASGITIKNAKYPLENASMANTDPYGVSNETLPGKTASVTVEEGKLLLIKVRPSLTFP